MAQIMHPSPRQLQQALLRNEQARQQHLELVLGAGPLIEGSFVTRGRKCGKPTCRCATGSKHYSKFLARSEGGRTRLVYVPAGDEANVAAKAEAYRQVRQARAELMKLATKTAELIDELTQALAEPYGPAPGARSSKRRGKRRKPDDGANS